MSNVLNVMLTEFKALGSNDVQCGILATDDYGSHAYLPADNWDDFKAEFPTLESVMDHVTSQPEFVEACDQYKMVDDQIVLTLDDVTPFSNIVVIGAEYLYG